MNFSNIAIIGVGLIGGSIALACKKNKSQYITGCCRTQNSVDKALELGIIDDGFIKPSEAVIDADLIILCTPLGTYKDIIKEISPNLKNGAVITDAGSVKHLPSLDILSELTDEQKPYFVPAHPIAGTEKSGAEAAFAELFEGKKVILTTTENTEAVSKVKNFWEGIGSDVEFLDSEKHDLIYAFVSHNIQFLSSCFGVTIKDYDLKTDIHFEKFIRLTNSDPSMWCDIFIYNADNIKNAISVFVENLNAIKKCIISDNSKTLKAYLIDAYKKRISLRELRGEISSPDYNNLNEREKVWIDIMPRLISSAIMNNKTEYKYAAGAGLNGFTKNIILDGGIETEDIIKRKIEVCSAIDSYLYNISLLSDEIRKKDRIKISSFLREGKCQKNQ